jgi:hypothetical protein
VSFETEFFGPGNRLRWDAIRTGALSADVQQRLGPFLEDLQRNPEIVTLPRVRESGEVQWYVLCSSARTTRLARDEVQAFLGPTYSNFEGRPTRLDPRDPVEAAVLAKYGTNAFRVDIPDRNILDAARERLRLLVRLQKERPQRHAKRVRAAGRVLRDFEYALLANQEAAAAECIEELRSAGQLSAANLLFLEVRRLAAGRHWDAILALPELQALLGMVTPRRVTEALIQAVYRSRLQEFEEKARAEEAVERFRSEIFPRFRDLYRTRASLSGFEVDASFLMAAACGPARTDVGHWTPALYSYDSEARAYLTRLSELIPTRRPTPELRLLENARAAFAEANIDQAYELALTLPPSFDRSALLLRCARDMGTLLAAQVALESVEALSASDRERLNQHSALARIRDTLVALSTEDFKTASTEQVAEQIPSTWESWLQRLTAPVPWKAAVFVAEIGAREWKVEGLLQDPEAVQEIADLLLSDRAEWGQAALRDALPYFLEFCISAGTDTRLKPLYEALFLAIALDSQVSLAQVAALLRVSNERFQLGLSSSDYVEILHQIASAIQAVDSPAVTDIALEALETVINSACPNSQERQQFGIQLLALFQRWYGRIEASQFALLKTLLDELGIAAVFPEYGAETSLTSRRSGWDLLNGKRIAIYSLQEPALRRTAEVIGRLCQGVRVDTFHDQVGGSPALRKASTIADVFILAITAAKHSATTFIESRRPKGLVTLYARGQGSAGLLRVLSQYIADQTVVS